jgi:cytochrome bd ubiquinol oxidase subunit II
MDYQIIWFVLLLVLFIGYVVLDGFDLGVGMVHLFAKGDKERRIMMNSIGPVWDANEVWLISAGGALFAAFPDVYATVFSGFYTAFILFLVVIIGRAVSIEFRGKVDSDKWKKTWDIVFNFSSYLIVILLGVSLGNIISGVPVAENKEFAGTFWGLLNPYSIFVALTAVLILRLHGRLYLMNKTKEELFERIKGKIVLSWLIFLVFFLILSLWTIFWKSTIMSNYNENVILYLVPCLTLLSIFLILVMLKVKKFFAAFLFSSLSIALLIVQAGISIFPNLVFSNPIPENSLTIFNSSSSETTLYTMFIIACIGIPLILIYKFIMYSAFRGKVKLDSSSY